MKLYQPDGWINAKEILEDGSPFVMIVGARGIGKTFSFMAELMDMYLKTGKRFIYMRRLENEADITSADEGNPFNAINAVRGWDVQVKRVNKQMKGFFWPGDDRPAGVIIALKTSYKKRSVSFTDYDYLFFDEFIPEPGAPPIKDEAKAFANMVETIARNRELEGKEPLKVVCASNANTVDNPLFIRLGLITRALNMAKNKVPVWRDPDRGLTLIVPFGSPISEKKKDTALYKLMKDDTEFIGMALDNVFPDDVSPNVKSLNLSQFIPEAKVGELCIYKHKIENRRYISSHERGTFPVVYTSGQMDLRRFRREQYRVWLAHMNRRVWFETYVQELLFEKYFEA